MDSKVAILQMILFVLCFLGGITILIFVLRKNDQGIDYDKIITLMKKQTEENLEALNEGNKKIDKIESKILDCKKKLKMELFDK